MAARRYTAISEGTSVLDCLEICIARNLSWRSGSSTISMRKEKEALIDEAPVQTQIELQGRSGSFRGIPVVELTPDSKAIAQELVDHILSIYPAEDVAYARECLEANGGIDRLFLSYYRHGEDGEIPEAQVFRLEGPSAVFYFRGYPHVHAFLNVAMDGDAPLSVGEALGINPTWLDRAGVKNLFEAALRTQTAADLSYYPEGSVAGRLRPGVIRAGDIYTLESWQEAVEVVQIRGSRLSGTLQNALRNRQIVTQPDKLYTVATTGYVATDLAEKLGRIESRRPGPMLRDLTVAYLRANGFRSRCNRPEAMQRPKAVLFDLFHTLVCVPPPSMTGDRSVPEILGVSADEWQRLYYDEDVMGRCLGRVRDSVEAMRLVTHSIDSSVEQERILAAVESRRRRFEIGLVAVEDPILVGTR